MEDGIELIKWQITFSRPEEERTFQDFRIVFRYVCSRMLTDVVGNNAMVTRVFASVVNGLKGVVWAFLHDGGLGRAGTLWMNAVCLDLLHSLYVCMTERSSDGLGDIVSVIVAVTPLFVD